MLGECIKNPEPVVYNKVTFSLLTYCSSTASIWHIRKTNLPSTSLTIVLAHFYTIFNWYFNSRLCLWIGIIPYPKFPHYKVMSCSQGSDLSFPNQPFPIIKFFIQVQQTQTYFMSCWCGLNISSNSAKYFTNTLVHNDCSTTSFVVFPYVCTYNIW